MDQIRVPQRSYYAQMLHLYDDCLDVYEYRLIGHYLRVGNCWEGIKTTAKKTKMSVGKASQTRQKLADDGWIRMKPNSRDGYDIEVVDLMVFNVLHYSGERVLDLETPPKTWSKAGVHDMKGGSPHETQGSSHETPYSPHETKNNQLRKTKEEEGVASAKPPKAGHQRAWESQWESPTTTDIEDQYERILDTRVVDPLSYKKKADVCRILANLNVTTDQLIQALDNAPYDDIRLANVIDLVRRQQTDSKPSHPFQEQIERYVTGAIDANGLTDDCKRWLKANGWSKDKLTRTTHKKDLSQTISRILSNGEFKHGTRIAVQ